MSAGIATLASPGGQACGAEGQVPGAAAAPLDHLADLSDRRTTYRRTYTKPPVGVSSSSFCPSDDPEALG